MPARQHRDTAARCCPDPFQGTLPCVRARRRMRERVSIDRHGRAAACPALPHEGVASLVEPAPQAPPEVLEFIRFCYRRRGIGWPELYDEMCGVAARGLFRGMDYARLEALGVGFSLGELPRLAGLAHQVVIEERAGRLASAKAAATGDGHVRAVLSPVAGAY